MSIYDNSGSSYSQAVKDGLRRISGSRANDWAAARGDYSFSGGVQSLRDANNSYFKLNFGTATDWDLHHIIPQEFIRRDTRVAHALRDMTSQGLFSMRDAVKNGIWLPNQQSIANLGPFSFMLGQPSRPRIRLRRDRFGTRTV